MACTYIALPSIFVEPLSTLQWPLILTHTLLHQWVAAAKQYIARLTGCNFGSNVLPKDTSNM